MSLPALATFCTMFPISEPVNADVCNFYLSPTFHPPHKQDDVQQSILEPITTVEGAFRKGSPRLLLYDGVKPIGNISASELSYGSMLNYKFIRHPALRKAVHLIAENTLLGLRHKVAGLAEPQESDDGPFEEPELVPTCTFFADQLKIVLKPSVTTFEDHFR